MRLIVSLSACLCILLSISALPSGSAKKPELDRHWDMFKTKFGKVYDMEGEQLRRLIWEENVNRIQKHNLEYDMGKHTYALGINHFADLTVAEFKEKYLVALQSSKGAHSAYMAPLNMQQLPDTVDWREKGLVTDVKNQAQCGSCWSFSTTGSLEGQYARKTGNLISFSEQQLVDCSRSYGNMGCNGGLMDNAFKYIEKFGIERESDYPYEGRDARCRYDADKVVTRVSDFTDVPRGDESSLQSAVATVGPVSVAIDAGHFSFQLYSHGVYNEPSCSSTALDHGVLAVGYGTEEGKAYWLVKNSWGPQWGMDGYIKMSRNADNQCGIATQASYPVL